eukprot:TRINITY_DN33720_c0_g2_i1.p1 TRINITY_DN33720_c0_g2~~TRINITY_DN33720_c0_g2_i1.p1  ORF type:complete len:179 (-),score=10.40 TRINITY_DN33720_c0_g2_i1:339-821(-)
MALFFVAIPDAYGLVMGAVGLSWAVQHLYMSLQVGKARKQYGVGYPNLYANEHNCKNVENIDKFNSVQRGHQNSLENQPIMLAMMMGTGLQHPVTAAVCGAIYSLGKVLYFNGYAKGGPKGRYAGNVAYIGALGLVGMTFKMGYNGILSLTANQLAQLCT